MKSNEGIVSGHHNFKDWVIHNLRLRLLILPFLGLLFFIAGESLAHYGTLYYIFFGISALLNAVFYIITLSYVIITFSYNEKKMFWLVAIVCLPMIGNIIYVIFMETANRRQKLHAERF